MSRVNARPSDLVTKSFDFDGGRLVTVYVPCGQVEAIVFAADGELVSPWGADLESTGGPAALVVGVHRHADESERLLEYSPGFDPERFARHEEFFADVVPRWIEKRFRLALPPSRSATFGASAGGELALAMGLRHPDSFGAVLCASPGAGYRPPELLPERLPRTYLVAGDREPFFRANAERWATALRRAGAEVVLEHREGAHGDPFWRDEFSRMVRWICGV
jgi:enterochelin esterase-like enzyme